MVSYQAGYIVDYYDLLASNLELQYLQILLMFLDNISAELNIFTLLRATFDTIGYLKIYISTYSHITVDLTVHSRSFHMY